MSFTGTTERACRVHVCLCGTVRLCVREISMCMEHTGLSFVPLKHTACPRVSVHTPTSASRVLKYVKRVTIVFHVFTVLRLGFVQHACLWRVGISM